MEAVKEGAATKSVILDGIATKQTLSGRDGNGGLSFAKKSGTVYKGNIFLERGMSTNRTK